MLEIVHLIRLKNLRMMKKRSRKCVRGSLLMMKKMKYKTKKRKSHKRKRDKERPHYDDALDDDDLELLLENSGLKRGSLSSGKFKRLKRKQIEDDEDEIESQDHQGEQQLRDIFSDDEEVEEEAAPRIMDEFDGFIEEDDFSDEDEQTRLERREQRKKKKQGPRIDTSNLSNVDRQSLLELFEVFGDGNEYDWALEAQELEDAGAIDKEEPASLDEVFEHSELKERMLTEEDNLIRIIDVPERYQMYRSALTYIDLDDEELELEKTWVANTLLKEKKAFLRDDWVEPFKQCVGQVVQFVSKENLEVPFIWNHRRDYLEYVDPDAPIPGSVRELMISEDDVWRIVKLDIEYHSLYEKRLNTEKLLTRWKLMMSWSKISRRWTRWWPSKTCTTISSLHTPKRLDSARRPKTESTQSLPFMKGSGRMFCMMQSRRTVSRPKSLVRMCKIRAPRGLRFRIESMLLMIHGSRLTI